MFSRTMAAAPDPAGAGTGDGSRRRVPLGDMGGRAGGGEVPKIFSKIKKSQNFSKNKKTMVYSPSPHILSGKIWNIFLTKLLYRSTHILFPYI